MKKFLIVGLALLIGMECSNSLLAKEKLVQSCPSGYTWCISTCVPNGQCGELVDVSANSLTLLELKTYFSCAPHTVLIEGKVMFKGHAYYVCQGESGVTEPVDQLNPNQYNPKHGTVYIFPAYAAVSCHKNRKPVQVSSSDELGAVYRCPH